MTHSVLICDDNGEVRALVRAVLTGGGYHLREVAGGQAVLDDLATSAADLVIMDVHMPGLDGIAVLRSIRANPALAGTKVLLLSGDAVALDAQRDIALGADAYLLKPFRIETLTETVRSLLGP